MPGLFKITSSIVHLKCSWLLCFAETSGVVELAPVYSRLVNYIAHKVEVVCIVKKVKLDLVAQVAITGL